MPFIAIFRCITRNVRTHVARCDGAIERWWPTWKRMFLAPDTGWFAWLTKSKPFATKSSRWAAGKHDRLHLRHALDVAVRARANSAKPATCGICSAFRFRPRFERVLQGLEAGHSSGIGVQAVPLRGPSIDGEAVLSGWW